MDKDAYRSLIPLANNREAMALLQAYAQMRIELARKQLDTGGDLESLRKHQGAIAELKRLLTLRDEVLERAK